MSKPTKIAFEMQLRGQQVAIECSLCGPDTSVGIFSRWSEEIVVKDPSTGNEVSLEPDLSDDEVEKITEAANEEADKLEYAAMEKYCADHPEAEPDDF